MHSVCAIPHNGRLVLCIVFHGDSYERIRRHDPAVLPNHDLLAVLPVKLHQLPLSMIEVLVAYEEDMEAFKAKAHSFATKAELLQYLARGWENKPEDQKPVEQF
jgi:hypothetical protein